MPDASLSVNASINGSVVNVSQAALVDGQAAYITLDSSVRPDADTYSKGINAMASSPDGKQIYAVNTAQSALMVLNADGSQRQYFVDGLNGVNGLGGASSVVVSQNGQQVYVLGDTDNLIAQFDRNALGNLTFKGTVATSGTSLLASADGQSIYVAGSTGIDQFARNASSGQLSALGNKWAQAVSDMALSDNGQTLAVVNSAAGSLTMLDVANGFNVIDQVNSTDTGLTLPTSVAIKGNSVYLASASESALTVLSRDAAGQLTVQQTLINGVDGVRGLLGVSDVVVSHDGRYVYASGAGNNGLVVFQSDAAQEGQLQFVQMLRNKLGDTNHFVNPSALMVDPTGAKLYAATRGDAGSVGGLVAFEDFSFDGALPEARLLQTHFSGMEALNVSTAGGEDNLLIKTAPPAAVASLNISTGAGKDRVSVLEASALTSIDTGEGADDVQVMLSTPGVNLNVATGSGADTVNVLSLSAGDVATIHAGNDTDLIKVAGNHLAATSSLTVDGQEPINPDDVLQFDPENSNPALPNFTLTKNTIDSGEVGVNGQGLVNFANVNLQVIAAPLLDLYPQPFVINEGGSLTLNANVTPLGTQNALAGDVSWDLDGDGQFGDAVGSHVTLTWNQLRDLGLNDDGTYLLAAKATNQDGFFTVKTAVLSINNTPAALTVSGSGQVHVGDPYTVTFSAQDPGDDHIKAWQLDWGDGKVDVLGSGATSASHVYARQNQYTVKVTALDEDGSSTASDHIVRAALTNSDLSVQSSTPILEGQALQLRVKAPVGATSMRWDLDNDGSFDDAQGSDLTLSWADLQALGVQDNGRYQARVQAQYELPASGEVQTLTSAAAFFDVLNAAPTASLQPVTATINEGETVTLSVSGVQDASSADQQAGFTYSYDFNNDGVFEVNASAQSSVTVPSSYLADNGVYTVRARVTDKDGGSIDLSTVVTVNNVAPTLSATGSDTTQEGDLYSLQLNANDPGQDTVSQWVVNWGDGRTDTFFGTPTVATHRFAQDGNKSIVVTAVDEDGSYTAANKLITVSNAAPQLSKVVITNTTENGLAYLSGDIKDPGTQDALSLIVNWGDGQSEQIALEAGTTHFELNHRYADEDLLNTGGNQYVVSLTANDGVSDSTPVNTSVTVSNAAPIVTGFGATQSVINEGGVTTVVGTISDAGLLDKHTVTLDWGDGQTAAVTVDPATRQFTATHQYKDSSTGAGYLISAVARDEDGGVSTAATTTVEVRNVAPTFASYTLDKNAINENDTVTLTGTLFDAGQTDTHTVMVDWGDGVSTAATVDTATRTFTATHRYLDDNPTQTASDSYQISMTVTDSDGASINLSLAQPVTITQPDGSTVTLQSTAVTVSNAAPTFATFDNNASVPGQVLPGSPVVLSGHIGDVGTLDTHRISIDWQDGQVDTFDLDPVTRNFNIQHAYAVPGIYDIKVTATDDDTGSVSLTSRAILSGVVLRDGVLYIVGTGEANNATLTMGDDGTVSVEADFPNNLIENHVFQRTDVNSVWVHMVGSGDHFNVVGTQGDDSVVLTDQGLSINGLGMTLVNADNLLVDGAGGNDSLAVKGSQSHIAATLAGGAGSDSFNVGGDDHTLSAIVRQVQIKGDASALTLAGAASDVDKVRVFSDGTSGASTGALSATTISGLGMAGSVDYGQVEQLDIYLGQGDDTFSVAGTADQLSANVFGGGGSDRITVLSRGAGARLSVMGDSSADGGAYTAAAGAVGYGAAYAFANSGNDVIDASASTASLVVYGGAGDDVLTGSQANDVLLGGGGADRINGGNGDDLIIGDTALGNNGELVNVATGSASSADALLAGSDTVSGDGGNDVIFGDKASASAANVFSVDLANVVLSSVQSASGADDTLAGGDGNDVIAGGLGKDQIEGGTGQDILMGDQAQITRTAGKTAYTSVAADNAAMGGNDTIRGGDGDDFILGQQGDDALYGDAGDDDITGGHKVIGGADGKDLAYGGEGSDVILGDNGLITRFNSLVVGEPFARFQGKFAAAIREVQRYDDADGVASDDSLYGDAGDDILHGQRGNDLLDGGVGDDELIGGLGDDQLTGGAGTDYLIGDVGTIFKAFNADGSARLNTNGSWHRDIYLEEVGSVTGKIDIDSTPLRTNDPALADKLLGADRVLLTGAYKADGSKQLNADNGAWDTDMLLIKLASAGNDQLTGGDGDDFLIGQRGADNLQGGIGNDVLLGDGMINTSPFASDLPNVQQGIRLLSSEAATSAGLNISQLGKVVTPGMEIAPEALSMGALADYQYGLGAQMASTVVEMGQKLGAGRVQRNDGAQLEVFASVVPEVVNHREQLAGNDRLDGGDGNDWIFGDKLTVTTVPQSDFVVLNGVREGVLRDVGDIQFGLARTALDHSQLNYGTNPSVSRVHDIVIGNDVISGGAGQDLIVGDETVMLNSYIIDMTLTDSQRTKQALAEHQALRDLKVVLNDFNHVVHEAQHQVLDAEIRIKPALLTADPDYHDLFIGNDTVTAGDGNDVVVGDQATFLNGILGSKSYSFLGECSQLPTTTQVKVELALADQELMETLFLAKHELQHHTRLPINPCGPQDFNLVQLAKVSNDWGYDLQMGNDNIKAEGGNDLVFGDTAVLFRPTLAAGVTMTAASFNTAAGLWGSNVASYLNAKQVNDEAHDACRSATSWHAGYAQRAGVGDTVIVTAGKDQIDAGTGDDIVLGDSQSLMVTNSSTAANINFLASNPWASSLYGICVTYNANADLISGGDGNDRLYGQKGNDVVNGDAGNDTIYGGSGTDTVNGGTGTNTVNTNGSDVLNAADLATARTQWLTTMSRSGADSWLVVSQGVQALGTLKVPGLGAPQ